MPENRASGPQISQTVLYTITPGTAYTAIVTAVSASTGLVRLTTFPPGGTVVDRDSVSYDGTGTVANTWRYPEILTGS